MDALLKLSAVSTVVNSDTNSSVANASDRANLGEATEPKVDTGLATEHWTEVVEERANEGPLLYRGLSGVLPESFFVPDAQGMITAVDTGFMSTR